MDAKRTLMAAVVALSLNAAARAQLTGAALGSFTLIERKDPISDRAQAGAILTSEEGTLTIGCVDSSTSSVKIALETKRLPKQAGLLYTPGYIQLRFDDLPAVNDYWNINGYFNYIDKAAHVASFARKLQSSERFVARQEADNGTNIDTIFDVVDARPALIRVGERCGDRRFLAALGLDPPPKQ
jgi:hypothetical protein